MIIDFKFIRLTKINSEYKQNDNSEDIDDNIEEWILNWMG